MIEDRKHISSMRIKQALSLRNMSQKDLRDKTGLGKSAISQYVNGIIVPKQDKIMLLSKALDVSPSWLMGISHTMTINDYQPDQYEEHLKDKPELLEIYKSIQNNEMQLMLFDKTKDLSKEEFEQILRIIDAVHMENK